MVLRLLLLLLVLALAAGCGGTTTNGDGDAASTTAAQATTAEETTAPASNEHFTNEDWGTVVGDPEAHEGARVTLIGKVFRAERDADGTIVQMWADHENSDENTVVAIRDPEFETVEGDLLRVYGRVHGQFEGENAFGATVTAPIVLADEVEKVSALDIRSEATTTFDGDPFRESGITIEPRIELAEDETRVFLTVRNDTDFGLTVYSSSVHLIADGRQYDSEYSDKGYPELISDLQPGAQTEGVIVFPAVTGATSFKLIVEGHSDDVDFGNYGAFQAQWSWESG